MCSIAGIVSKKGEDVSQLIMTMLSMMRHRGPDSVGVAVNGEVRTARDFDSLDLGDVEGPMGVGHTGLAVLEEGFVPQPLVGCGGRLSLVHDGEIYNDEELRQRLSSHDFKSPSGSEVVLHLIEDQNLTSLLESVLRSLPQLYGVYSFAVMGEGHIVVVRDPMGVKPIYFGEDGDYLAFASERKALWRIGLREVRPLLPGHVAAISRRVFVSFLAQKLEKPRILDVDMETASLKLRDVLYNAFRRRLKGVKRVGVSFSGGVDSSLTARIVDDLGVDVMLYTAGLEESHDIGAAYESAKELDFPLCVRTLSMDDVEYYTSRVVYAIEETNVMNVGVGLPLYVAAESARQYGIGVMMSGHGLDELFGGYYKYLKLLRKSGYQSLNDELWRDLTKIFHVDLRRDDAVTMANGVELRLPFLDLNVVATAMGFPPNLKISGPEDRLRKGVLRRVAEMSGLPTNIVNRPKKSAQYGSGVDKALRRLSRGYGFKRPRDYLDLVFKEVFKSLLG